MYLCLTIVLPASQQGSLYYRPKQCTIFQGNPRKVIQTFASSYDTRQNRSHLMIFAPPSALVCYKSGANSPILSCWAFHNQHSPGDDGCPKCRYNSIHSLKQQKPLKIGIHRRKFHVQTLDFQSKMLVSGRVHILSPPFLLGHSYISRFPYGNSPPFWGENSIPNRREETNLQPRCENLQPSFLPRPGRWKKLIGKKKIGNSPKLRPWCKYHGNLR